MIATYWVQLVVVVVVTGDDNYNSSSDYSGVDCVEGVIKTVSFVTMMTTCRTGSVKKVLLSSYTPHSHFYYLLFLPALFSLLPEGPTDLLSI